MNLETIYKIKYPKEYDFFSFAKNMIENLSNKYSQKLLDHAKKSTTDAIKTATQATRFASKKAIQKTAEATGDLIGNKIADKITSVSKKLHSKNLQRSYIHKIIQKKQKMK